MEGRLEEPHGDHTHNQYESKPPAATPHYGALPVLLLSHGSDLEDYQRIPLNALGMKASWDADEFWQEVFKAGTEHRFSPDQYGQQVG